jgi:hypothetical protein
MTEAESLDQVFERAMQNRMKQPPEAQGAPLGNPPGIAG